MRQRFSVNQDLGEKVQVRQRFSVNQDLGEKV